MEHPPFSMHEKFQKKFLGFFRDRKLDFSEGTQVDLTDVFQRVQAKLDQIPSDCTSDPACLDGET